MLRRAHEILTTKVGAGLKFNDTIVSKEYRFSVGVEEDSGRCYISFPVSNGLVDYDEYYEITQANYRVFLSSTSTALAFVNECRQHQKDSLLIIKPGSNRGTPA